MAERLGASGSKNGWTRREGILRRGTRSNPGVDEIRPVPDPPLSSAEVASARFRAVLELIGEGVVIYDHTGAPVFRNAPAQRYLSERPADALAVQAVSDLVLEALGGGYQERTLDLRSPQPRTLVIRTFPLTSGSTLLGAVAIIDDVSERTRLESIRRDFVANVSHELKTPVGALSLLAETLDGEEDAEVVSRLAGRVGAEAERLVRIIDDLLDLSRIEASESSRQELVGVERIIDGAADPLRPVAESLGIALHVREVPPYLAVAGERRDLVSAVSNLIDNAIKYSERGSQIDVRASSEGSMIQITVADQGVGIPARDRERIFERFYRVDRARSRSTGGTGLGLSIVRHVAVNHGGDVWVSSVEGEGSTFTLQLPAAALAGVDRGRGESPGPDPSGRPGDPVGRNGLQPPVSSPGEEPSGA